jgi:hypothetical protein
VATKDIVPQTGEIVEFRKWMEGVPLAQEDEDVQEQIALRIMQAETVDDLLTPSTAEGLRDWVDKPIVIHDARLRKSNLPDGVGAYLVLDIEDAKDGKHYVATTGAINVMAQIIKAHNQGWLPMSCKVIEVVSNSDPSRKPQWLVRLDHF